MVWLKVKSTATQTRDVQLPSSVAHRSTEGDTLIIAPGLSYEVTDEEWAFIKDQHPGLVMDLEFSRPCESSSTSPQATP